MTYQRGSAVLASDFNGFITAANGVYGTGHGDSGYGQAHFFQGTIAVGQAVLGLHWDNLRNIIALCGSQQGTVVSSLPPEGILAAGQPVAAYTQSSPTLSAYEIANNITAIQTNRLTAASGGLSLVTSAWTVTRASSWTPSISSVVAVSWSTEDNARFFFNSGGQIRLHGSQPGSSAQDTAWNNTLANGMGIVKFSAYSTANTGSISGSVSLGFYNLTDSYQTVFTGNIATGLNFSAEHLTIQAKRLNYAGANGGNGNAVQFIITLTDTGLYAGNHVDSGTNIVFDYVKASTLLGIQSPTYTTVTPF